MSTLTIHNWERWQSYRADRGQPPWIKIHREVMRNIEWVSLTDAQRGQLVAIWLLAADHNGVIPASSKIIQKLCHLDTEPDLNIFIKHGFIDGDARVTPEWRQHDQPEKRREEKSREEKSREEATPSAFCLPDWINKSNWDLWVKSRKKMSPEQKQGQVDKLDAWRSAGLDYSVALHNAAINGSQGLFLPNQPKGRTPPPDNFSNRDYGTGVQDL